MSDVGGWGDRGACKPLGEGGPCHKVIRDGQMSAGGRGDPNP